MQILRALVGCIVLLMLSSNSIAKNMNEAESVNYLLKSIKDSKVYVSWIKEECLIVKPETSTTEYYDLALKEKHSGNCKGDPVTEPIIDRFRVYSTNKVLWHDLPNNRYLPFKQFVNLRKVKQ